MLEPSVSLFTTEVKYASASEHISYAPMDDMGNRIRTLREAKGWTQQQLGNELGVSREAVSQWEKGITKNIKNVTFARLIQVLGTTQEYLLFGPDERLGGRPGKRRPA